ncbi:MAG: galactokinase, partial [Actinobacteria bacterium]|nr:galactokinase [Actinomycetota bacterium]
MSIRELFSETFGLAPDLLSAAPGRVNLIGEHVDYNDGFVLPFAIDALTYCAIRIREDSRIRIASKQEGGSIFETEIASLTPLSGPVWTRYI